MTSTTPINDLYQQELLERGYQSDAAQLAAVAELERCAREWGSYKAKRSNALKKMIFKPDTPKGVYMHGGVGRGKSFLMDCFFNAVPIKRKTRLHFHEFMREVHRELADIKGVQNPLSILGQRISKKFKLICFDEFHVNDIADAMVLYRLLEALFENGVGLIMTSNFAPDAIYPNGLHRDRIMPAIALIKQNMEVMSVDNGTDYRRRTLENAQLYYSPADAAAESAMAAIFQDLAETHDEDPLLHIESREIQAKRRAGGVVWFDFATLCGGPRSQNDYLELSSRFHTIMLSGIPQMFVRHASEARRFTWLIDVMYDRRVKFVCSAAVAPELLYTEGPLAHEFVRTVSRLHEMQSIEFMREGHRHVDTAIV